MADASCSGGTPFKQLIDHQSRDVSHHQDRLINGNQANGSFRSTPQHMQQGPQEGFSAFMDSPIGLPGMHHDPAGRLAAHAAALQPTHAAGPFDPTIAPELTYLAHTASPAPAMSSSSWAADFSQFAAQQSWHRQPQPQPQQQQQRQGPMFAGANHPMQMNFQSAFAPQQTNLSSFFAPAGAAYAQPAAAGEADFDQEMAKWMASNTATSGNMERVDAAMEQMARELELNEAALAETETAAATAMTADALDAKHFSDLGVPELGNLSLEGREEPTVVPPEPLQEENTAADMLADDDARNKSAVSEAAERLLESVQHENGEKWQNSVFLALMRDFRDGKKDIVGNEVQDMDGVLEEGAAAAATISTENGHGGEGSSAAQATQAPAT